jgi:hypothetical protein
MSGVRDRVGSGAIDDAHGSVSQRHPAETPPLRQHHLHTLARRADEIGWIGL